MAQKMLVPLKYLSNFGRTLQMSLINCEINLQLKWSENCFLVDDTAANQATRFILTDTNLYVPVVTLSIQDNVELVKPVESGFKRIINWNKDQFKVTPQT